MKVSDGKVGDDTSDVKVTVIHTNHAPKWVMNPLVLGDGVEDSLLSINVSGYATDADGDVLTFKKVSGPSWVSVSAMGVVSGTPSHGDLGVYVVVVEVRDLESGASVNANGAVVLKNYAPVVHGEALQFVVKERGTLKEALNQAKYVEDINGDALTFKLVDAVSWVTLSGAGELVISPLHAQLGEHSVAIQVSDGKLSTDGKLFIKVICDDKRRYG